MKIVINKCFGGFGLSKAALKRYAEISGIVSEDLEIPRDDPALVQTVEELGKKANDSYSELKVVDVPDDVEWQIHYYDGLEHIEEQHRTWR